MNWLHFTLWVGGLYALYYLIIIIADLSRGSGSPASGGSGELTFAENITPLVPDHKEHLPPEPAVISSGGVSVREMFGLARKEMLVFTQAVSF